MSFIRRIPVPLSALALAVATLGNLLAPYSPAVKAFCGGVAAVLVLLLVLRFALDSRSVRKELENPAQLAVLPAFFMALMVLATYLNPLAPTAAFALWVTALVLQIAVSLLFVKRFVLSFDLAKVLPSWFLVFVGYVAASVTSPAFGAQSIGRVLLYAGLVGYIAILSVAIYRMRKVGDLPEPALPTVAIFAAPPSLCLAGYLAVTEAKQVLIVYVLLALSAASIAYLIVKLPKIIALKFHPSLAALTFPVVISAVAMKQSSAFLEASAASVGVPQIAVLVMSAFAVGMVVYVLFRYIAFLLAPTAAS